MSRKRLSMNTEPRFPRPAPAPMTATLPCSHSLEIGIGWTVFSLFRCKVCGKVGTITRINQQPASATRSSNPAKNPPVPENRPPTTGGDTHETRSTRVGVDARQSQFSGQKSASPSTSFAVPHVTQSVGVVYSTNVEGVSFDAIHIDPEAPNFPWKKSEIGSTLSEVGSIVNREGGAGNAGEGHKFFQKVDGRQYTAGKALQAEVHGKT